MFIVSLITNIFLLTRRLIYHYYLLNTIPHFRENQFWKSAQCAWIRLKIGSIIKSILSKPKPLQENVILHFPLILRKDPFYLELQLIYFCNLLIVMGTRTKQVSTNFVKNCIFYTSFICLQIFIRHTFPLFKNVRVVWVVYFKRLSAYKYVFCYADCKTHWNWLF